MKPQILVVDDEPQIRKFLRIMLTANGYEVVEAENAGGAIRAALAHPPDLLVLDLGLPDMDGQDVISAVRERSALPILVLSVRADELDKVEALDRGANDYVTKPFGVGELMARIRALLRTRAGTDAADVVELGALRVDFSRRVVTRAGGELHLSRKEWDLLALFARHPDHVLTHKHILREVWGPAHTGDTAYLRVYVKQLRQKLEDDPAQPRLLVTDPGVGYRLKREE